MRELGDKPQTHSHLVFELEGWFNGKNKETGAKCHLVIFLCFHFFKQLKYSELTMLCQFKCTAK